MLRFSGWGVGVSGGGRVDRAGMCLAINHSWQQAGPALIWQQTKLYYFNLQVLHHPWWSASGLQLGSAYLQIIGLKGKVGTG